jgi:hypothetical protein
VGIARALAPPAGRRVDDWPPARQFPHGRGEAGDPGDHEMIVETFLMMETKTPIRGKSFRCNPNFHGSCRRSVIGPFWHNTAVVGVTNEA